MMSDHAAPSPELISAVMAELRRSFEWDARDDSKPLRPTTEIEDTYNISGDDVWEILENVQSALRMMLADDFDAPAHFTQERGFGPRVTEPLTPLIIARSLRPLPELTGRVIDAIAAWIAENQIRPLQPIVAHCEIEGRLGIRGDKTKAMLSSVCQQLGMTLAPEFSRRSHLKAPTVLHLLIAGDVHWPLTPDMLATYLRPGECKPTV